eukprot:GHVO01022185.1.p1 GENE.GHVO01022185.1~~GHVO01022185.1.p1  ORF type:complete len:165 (-),score=14.35 GHVO01022185.1:42-536(-)
MLFCSSHSIEESAMRINTTLQIIDRWATTWGMRFNHSKTSAMVFSRTEVNANLTFGNQAIKIVHTHKHLGFVLSDDLRYSPHIDTICRKAASEIFLLKRLSLTCQNINILSQVFKSCVLPVLEYASLAWAGLSITDQNRLDEFLRRALRIIHCLPYHNIIWLPV